MVDGCPHCIATFSTDQESAVLDSNPQWPAEELGLASGASRLGNPNVEVKLLPKKSKDITLQVHNLGLETQSLVPVLAQVDGGYILDDFVSCPKPALTSVQENGQAGILKLPFMCACASCPNGAVHHGNI